MVSVTVLEVGSITDTVWLPKSATQTLPVGTDRDPVRVGVGAEADGGDDAVVGGVDYRP
jgi:hypothetical protein